MYKNNNKKLTDCIIMYYNKQADCVSWVLGAVDQIDILLIISTLKNKRI
jgi:hypothetical protein